MDYEITPNGNLRFTIEGEEREMWREKMAEPDTYVSIVDIFSESGLPGNTDLEVVRPEEVGALTDSPIFAYGCERADDFDLLSAEHLWWFPNYQIEDPGEILIRTGQVLFRADRVSEKDEAA